MSPESSWGKQEGGGPGHTKEVISTHSLSTAGSCVEFQGHSSHKGDKNRGSVAAFLVFEGKAFVGFTALPQHLDQFPALAHIQSVFGS